MKTNYPIKKLSWKGYDILAKNILKQVEILSIDCVLSVLRGGTILGLSLANNLDVPSYYIKIRRSSSNEVNSDFSDPEMLGQIEIEKIKDKVVLVCEDVIDTEITIKKVIKELELLSPKKIIISTLYNFSMNEKYISGFNSKIHFWVVFPWERRLTNEDKWS